MHWFEQLYRLYGERDIPLFHEYVATDICVDLSISGEFISARYAPQRSTIPVTELSANRTVNIAPHPLFDTIQNLTEPKRRAVYLSYLSDWAASPFSDKRLSAVLGYIGRDTLKSDLISCGIQPLSNSVVRFSVDGTELCGDRRLIDMHINFTRSLPSEMGICCISGEYTTLCRLHSKRITSANSSAKLISKRERGRINLGGVFHSAEDTFPIGREVSFKAHAVLKRLVTEGAMRLQDRIFVAFDERGDALPLPFFKETAEPHGNVTILGLCEATKGRLSVTLCKRLSPARYLNASPKHPLPERHGGIYYEQLLSRV